MIQITDSKFEKILSSLDDVTWLERVAFFSWWWADRFLLWWYYYFREDFKKPLAPFHYEWIEEIFNGKNVLIEGFRWSIKTALVTKVVSYKACIKTIQFAVWQSFGDTSSVRNTTQIALSLKSERLERDYGVLFSTSWGKEDLEKKSVWDFDTRTWVKVLASSLWQKLRGVISKNQKPDLLVLDDIDVSDSVRNKDVIDKNYEKINEETIGALSKEWYQIIFLWNTIKKDGIVPRFRKDKKSKKNWVVFHQPLIVDDVIQWDFFTEEMIEVLIEDSTPSSFNANYKLIPNDLYEWGKVRKDHIMYYDSIDLDDFDELFMHIDTTHTANTTSDFYCILVAWKSTRDNNYYVVDFTLEKALVDVQALNSINTYKKFWNKIKKFTFDEKAHNSFWYWVRELAKNNHDLSLPIEELKYSKDKVTHFDPHTPHFVARRVYLPLNHPMILEAETQLISFPNKKVNDDFVDWISWAFDNFIVERNETYFF